MRAWLLIIVTFIQVEAFAQTKESPARLQCQSGTKVTGEENRWSPLSVCAPGFTVTGLSRVDLLGPHDKLNVHVNDFICDDKGCKAWCIGTGCTVEARCCQITIP